MKHSKKKSSSLLPAMLSAGVCAVSLGGGIVASIPSVAYANSVDTQSTPSVSNNDTDRGVREHAQSNHAANPSSNNQTAAQSTVAARTVSTDLTPAQPQDDSLTWTKDDFNISADGKTIGLTGLNKTNGYPGLNAKGIAKLKKNHHLVIPDGVEVILNNSFIGQKTDDTFIEGITLPDSLKVIEDGAFSWQKIKGTVVIPKNVIAVHPAAFLGNEIEKVVFKSTLAETGKFNSTDDHAYYVAGLGNRAFQGNKIKEIEFTGKLTNYKFHVDSNEKQNPSAAPFSNQELDEITLTVGDEFKMPVTIKQNGNDYKILNMVLAGDKNNHVSLEESGYFKKENGKIVAFKPGSIQTQCLFYDTVNNFRPVGTVAVTYKIVPKPKIYTVTFVNEANQNYAKVQVKEGKSINDKSVLNQVMPANPSKVGYTFRGWSTDKTGKDKTKEFSASTSVTGDITVYAIYTPTPAVLNASPSLIVQDKTITEGDPIDLRSLIVSATDPEDGDLKDKIVIADQGGFTNTKPGSYKIVFQVTDKGKACVSKTATITVNKKSVPVPVPPAPAPTPVPTPVPVPVPTPAPTPAPSSNLQPASQAQPSKNTPQHVLPKTGDVSSLGMLAAALGASCAILGTLGKKSFQKRK